MFDIIIAHLWEQYKFLLIGLFLIVGFLIILFLLAEGKTKLLTKTEKGKKWGKSKNKQKNDHLLRKKVTFPKALSSHIKIILTCCSHFSITILLFYNLA